MKKSELKYNASTTIAEICKHIAGFFSNCHGMLVSYSTWSSHKLDWKKDENGDYVIGEKVVDGKSYPLFYMEDRTHELRIYTQDLEKAACLSNIIRHQHIAEDEFPMATLPGAKAKDGSPIQSKEAYGLKRQVLNVKVMIINDVDPMADDDADAIEECYGIIPFHWNDLTDYAAADRFAPGSINEDAEFYPAIPSGAPTECEQEMWEEGFEGDEVTGEHVKVSAEQALKWKWHWLEIALRDNPNIAEMSETGADTGFSRRLIECSREPLTFADENALMTMRYTSVLPADIFSEVFAVFGGIEVTTYARKSTI